MTENGRAATNKTRYPPNIAPVNTPGILKPVNPVPIIISGVSKRRSIKSSMSAQSNRHFKANEHVGFALFPTSVIALSTALGKSLVESNAFPYLFGRDRMRIELLDIPCHLRLIGIGLIRH